MDEPNNPDNQQPVQPPEPPKKRSLKEVLQSRKFLLIILAIILTSGLIIWIASDDGPKEVSISKVSQKKDDKLRLDPDKNYGNKYADGLLPVGDGKYTTNNAKKGYVYACDRYAGNLSSGGGGAQTRGPWFVNNNKEYDINKKVSVSGNVSWGFKFSNLIKGDMRAISTNDLPNHDSGIFPVASSDKAYKYDRNPNAIKSQDLSYSLKASPNYGKPKCMSGEVGIMLTGVVLLNAFDAGGRDAGAWETQDDCDGHPQQSGQYHYHTLSSCIEDISVNKVIGFALDGFPITGPKVGKKNFLTTSDLDKCHGITSEITLDNKRVEMYHYVMTQDFPYSISCFRGKAITSPSQQGTQNQQNGPLGSPAPSRL